MQQHFGDIEVDQKRCGVHFDKALLARHGAADVLPVNVFFGDVDIVHNSSAFFLFQSPFQKRHKGSLA